MNAVSSGSSAVSRSGTLGTRSAETSMKSMTAPTSAASNPKRGRVRTS